MADEKSRRELERRILWHLLDNGSSTAWFDETLAEGLDLPVALLREMMDALLEKGCVTREPRGDPPQPAWFLTDKGIDQFYAR